MLAGRDVLAAAQTGTGKTAAFALPILERLKVQANSSFSPARHPVRALVVTPTRELAIQVARQRRGLRPARAAAHDGASTAACRSSPRSRRSAAASRSSSPRRAGCSTTWDSAPSTSAQVEVLVLDEADRMLDMGFIDDIRKIVALLPARRQNLLFSATFSDEIRRLAQEFLHDPATVEVAARNTAAEGVEQVLYLVDRDRKEDLLHPPRPARPTWSRCSSSPGPSWPPAGSPRTSIGAGVNAVAIHWDRSQPERTRALEEFKRGEVTCLVATDVASRGLDIEELPYVVNFELPFEAQDYVHRIGRTGRAGSTGHRHLARLLDEVEQLKAVQRLLKKPIPYRVVEGFEPDRTVQARPIRGLRPGRRGSRRRGTTPTTSRSGPARPVAGRARAARAGARASAGGRRCRRAARRASR